jgi:hypothetical protein
MPSRAVALLALGVLLVPSGPGAGRAGAAGADNCVPRSLPPGYAAEVEQALRAKEDLWGNELLASPEGPTYAAAAEHLEPLFLARASGGRRLTSSGAHYVAFSGPVGAHGADRVTLHVADGSQLLSHDSPRRSLTVWVGQDGHERFGECSTRLELPTLASGYLPILATRYVDEGGARYRQESFSTRLTKARSLVSLIALTADTRGSGATTVRFTVSQNELERRGSTLTSGRNTVLAFAPDASVEGSSVSFRVPADVQRTVYVAWWSVPAPAGTFSLRRSSFAEARASLVRYWSRRIREGATIEVPEQHVENAYRALLAQNLALTWRYSVGNQYEEFSYPEGIDATEVLSLQGFPDVARSMLMTSLHMPLTRYPNWKMGQKLVGSALYYRLFHDRSYVDQATPDLAAYVSTLGRQIRSSRRGLLKPERYSSDIPDVVIGLHTQAVVWQGLEMMGAVWNETGRTKLAAETLGLAARLHNGLRAAIHASERRLPDGALFVPARLLGDEKPYDTVTESHLGGYWNLVAPYAFASGLFPARSTESRAIIRYLLLHGSRLLGVVRAGAYSLYGLNAPAPTSGVNAVYGLNVSRFLSDNDRPDQLVLSLYGQLAVAMAPGTFVAGEGVSVTPLDDETYRSMYLPPNGASNGTFLETLRLMLVHETRNEEAEPRGLQLAFATPRAWLRPGREISVRRAPTSFGPLSFSMRSSGRSVSVTIDVPNRSRPTTLELRVRLPHDTHVTSVQLNGRAYGHFDARREVIELPTKPGRLDLLVRTRRS